MKKILFLFLTSYFLLLVSILSAQINKIQLENGFTLIHLEKKEIKLVSVNLFIKRGSASESDKEAGLTNLMADLLLEGTVNRTSEKIAIETELLGESISASCSNDFVGVSMIVPSENIVSAFDIFSDVINNASFPEKQLEKEKNRTIAAIKSKSDNIFDVAYDQFNEAIFENQPYHKPVEGYESTVSSINISQISDNYRKCFKPGNMVLSIAGDIDFEKAEMLVRKYFGNIKIIESEEKALSQKQFKDNWSNPSRKIYSGKFQQSYIMSGFVAPSINQKEYSTIKLINALVGNGMGSMLFTALRERNGLVYEADSFYPTRKEISAFVLYAGTSKENIGLVERTFQEELKKISEVNEEELKNAKEYLKGTYLLEHRTIQRQAWYLGWWEVMGKGYNYDMQYLNDIDNVSIADIKEVCGKYFNVDKLTTVIIK
ncbi:MAG: pitrilysin family protein [Elusimicrobia bacterium]|nr:pitrilysin family protein [Elusimicrobiota bacterium]